MRITVGRVTAGIFLAIAVAIGAWCGGAFRTVISDIVVVDLRRAPDAEPLDPRQGPKLKLVFRSATNLRKLIRDEDAYGVSLDVSLCPYDHHRLVGTSSVTHNQIDVTDPIEFCSWPKGKMICRPAKDTPAFRAEVAGENSTGPFTYEAEFTYGPISHFDDARHQFMDEPVPAKPIDLCFKVHAYPRQFGPQGFTSSEVRIPAALVARALAAR